MCRSIAVILLSFAFAYPSPAFPASDPWRLGRALQLPQGFSLSGQHRTRFENLDGQFRSGRDGGDQVLMLRTLVRADVRFEHIGFTAEMLDARSALADSGSPLSGSFVNPVDLLQAYVEIGTGSLFMPDGESRLRAGRITMDAGSRRLVARNRFRNTINAFTGVDWQWTGADGSLLRAFYTLPIQRRFDGKVLDNDPKLDKEFTDVRFWGLFYAPGKMPWGDRGEVYLFGLNENDDPDLATRNRDIYTAGLRLYRPATKSRFNYQIESVWQFGESRTSTSAADIIDLDHFAHFQHVEIGYTFAAPWSPQLLLQYDYASGDDNPADGDNNRFDTLYGARRFDFGPTSIYGPFARSNLSTPGIRLKLKPRKDISSFLSLRRFWLASDNDAWTTAGIRNPPGRSDNYIGTQIEIRFRWEPLPDNLRFEAGAAHLFAGDVMENAGKEDSTYLYSQAVFWF